jgi:hypothetical protein
LDYETEKRIGEATLNILESELKKLLPNDGEGMEDIDVPEATIRRNKTAHHYHHQQQQLLHGDDYARHNSMRPPENEFAMELLHIMRTSQSFLS